MTFLSSQASAVQQSVLLPVPCSSKELSHDPGSFPQYHRMTLSYANQRPTNIVRSNTVWAGFDSAVRYSPLALQLFPVKQVFCDGVFSNYNTSKVL
jgi:hypothetical protein